MSNEIRSRETKDVISLIKKNGLLLKSYNKEIRSNPDVIEIAVEQNILSVQYIHLTDKNEEKITNTFVNQIYRLSDNYESLSDLRDSLEPVYNAREDETGDFLRELYYQVGEHYLKRKKDLIFNSIEYLEYTDSFSFDYNGYGDSWYVDTHSELPNSLNPVRESIENFCLDLCGYFMYSEINEGSAGSLYFDLESRNIIVRNTANIGVLAKLFSPNAPYEAGDYVVTDPNNITDSLFIFSEDRKTEEKMINFENSSILEKVDPDSIISIEDDEFRSEDYGVFGSEGSGIYLIINATEEIEKI